MEFVNFKISPLPKKGLPCELLFYIGKLFKNSSDCYVNIETDNLKSTEAVKTAISNLLKHYKIKNIILSNEPFNMGTKIINISSKLQLFFSPQTNEKEIQENKYLTNFITQYEKFFGNLPFFSNTNKDCEKYLFLNDVILGFGDEVLLH